MKYSLAIPVEQAGAFLRFVRIYANLSRRDVARRTGLSVSTIGRLERGETSTTIITIALVSGALGIQYSVGAELVASERKV